MPKEILVDPKLHRRAGTLSFADIPIHSYATPLDHERKRHGDARLVELLRAMLVIREFETVPPMLKESAYGLGATTTEVVWQIVLPFTRVGVFGGVLLGLGTVDVAVQAVARERPARQRVGSVRHER